MAAGGCLDLPMLTLRNPQLGEVPPPADIGICLVQDDSCATQQPHSAMDDLLREADTPSNLAPTQPQRGDGCDSGRNGGTHLRLPLRSPRHQRVRTSRVNRQSHPSQRRPCRECGVRGGGGAGVGAARCGCALHASGTGGEGARGHREIAPESSYGDVSGRA